MGVGENYKPFKNQTILGMAPSTGFRPGPVGPDLWVRWDNLPKWLGCVEKDTVDGSEIGRSPVDMENIHEYPIFHKVSKLAGG